MILSDVKLNLTSWIWSLLIWINQPIWIHSLTSTFNKTLISIKFRRTMQITVHINGLKLAPPLIQLPTPGCRLLIIIKGLTISLNHNNVSRLFLILIISNSNVIWSKSFMIKRKYKRLLILLLNFLETLKMISLLTNITNPLK